MKNQIHFRDCSYTQFCDEIAVLDLHDKSGDFKVRQKLKPYFEKLDDQRLERFDEFYFEVLSGCTFEECISFHYSLLKGIAMNVNISKQFRARDLNPFVLFTLYE